MTGDELAVDDPAAQAPLLAGTLQVVVPARNAARYLDRCLEGLLRAGFAPRQITVVDDASDDDTAARARAHGVRLLRLPERTGASGTRNAGAAATLADSILFVDADVVVYPDVKRRVLRALEDPDVAAVFGSYDPHPDAPGVVSRYRNLLHHFIHQQGHVEAHTFWTGCGAVRRHVLAMVGGFDVDLHAMEDIDLGMRLRARGWQLRLDHDMLCIHLKRWSFAGMVQTDLLHRAVPWGRLVLARGDFAPDLNLSHRQRLAVALTGIAGAALLLTPLWAAAFGVFLLASAGVIAANAPFFALLARTRGASFALLAAPLQLVHHACAGLGFAYALLEYALARLGRRHRDLALRWFATRP